MKRIYLIVVFLIICLAVPAIAEQQWPFLPDALAKKDTYSLSTSRIFPKALIFTQKNYVEPERIEPKEMFKGSLDDVQKLVPEILVEFNSPTSFTITIDKAVKKFSSPLKNLEDFWELMNKIFAFVELNYKGNVKLSDIESTAINGALRTLDPHSALLTPEFYKEFQIDTGGEFGGLGIVITSKDGQLTVIAPIEDTPAWKAGIKSGDTILQIDDESTINMSLMKAVERLRGKVGSKVTLKVERKGKPAPFSLTLTRANIHIDSIKSAIIKDGPGDVGYIKIKRFQKETVIDFLKQLKKQQTESGPKFKGLIVDLRNNPGGLLDEAVEIADTFLPEGVIVSTVGANKKFIDEERAHLKGTEPSNYPLIVLINEGSASASEIVAGALQAHGRALVIGQKSFGKGSVQSVYNLEKDYALKLTIAQYLNAGKYSIQTVGITPDIIIEPVIIDKEYIDIEPNKPPSEMELEKHLNQITTTSREGKITIGYFKPYVDDEEVIEEMRRKEYARKPEFEDDFAVKLATKIMLNAKSARPAVMVKEANNAIEMIAKQEQEKISAELSELGTIWAKGTESGSSKLEISSHINQDGKIVSRAAAGKNIDLILTVTNRGNKPVHKLIGIIEAENTILDEREFVFGRLDPEMSLSKKIEIKLHDGLNSINIPFKVKFKQGDKPLATEYGSSLPVNQANRPRFSFNYELEKPRTVGPRNPLPMGKSVPLTVKVKNIGTGPTKEADAFVSNKENEKGLFIEKGRSSLGVIKPGEIKKAVFSFRVQPDIKVSSFRIELTLSDRELLEFLTSDLEVTLQSGDISPHAGIWYEGPKVELNDKVLPIVTTGEKYNLKGKISDNDIIKDYYIFVNDEKVVYNSNPDETASVEFNVALKLKKGNNTATIIARDNNSMAEIKTLVIQRGAF